MMKIKAAKQKHTRQIVDFIVAGAHEGSFDSLNEEKETRPYLKKDIESIIKQGKRLDADLHAHALVIVDKDHVAGFAIMSDMPPNMPGCELYGYYLEPDYRGKGHGKNILNTLIRQAQPECRDFYVRCRKEAEVMYQLLIKLGFTDVGHTETGARILHKALV